MAICSTRVKTISRSKGHSVVAAAAYRRGICLYDERLQSVKDYSQKSGAIYSELAIPEGSPDWLAELSAQAQDDPISAIGELWNFVDSFEIQKNAQMARNLYFALPIEFNATQNIALMRDCVKAFTSQGMVVDWSIHFDIGNPHAHLLITMRELTLTGFGKKVREWNDWSHYKAWRHSFAETTNHHLAKNGFDVRIDPRSYAEQGIDLRPTIHVGKSVTEQERRGEQTERLEEQRIIQRENLTRINDNPHVLFDAISHESTSFSSQKVAQTLSRYINPHDGEFSVFPEEFLKNQQQEYSRDVSGNDDAIRTSVLNNFDAVSGFEDSTATQNASTRPHAENSVPDDSTQKKQEPEKPTTFESILKAIEQHESVFSERDVSRAVFSVTPDAELFAKTLAAVKLQMTQSTHVLSLGLGDDGRERFTTRKMFELENDIQKITDTLKSKHHSDITKSTLKQALKQHAKTTGKTLTPEQNAALLHLIKPAALSCMVGRAGTGKSFTIGAVKTVYEAAGFDVQGIALSGIAADGLNRDAGIKSQTIASFTFALKEYPQLLNNKSVLIMDEAGMTDSASMHAVLDAAKQAGAKVILLGDPDQLQPVGPGAIFRAILERVGFTEIQTIYRQVEAWQKEATQAFARGDVDAAIDTYAEKGFVHLEKSEADAMGRLVSDWKSVLTAQSIATSVAHETPQAAFERFGKLLAEQLVITYRNNDVQLLNTMLRQSLVSSGHLSEGYAVDTEGGQRRIAQGERLLFLKSKHRLGVSNGRFGTVTSVDFLESGKVRTFKVMLDGQDKAIVIDPKTYKHFDYGYTATVHKTQGVTKDRAFVYVAGNLWNRSLTYVAMTRHRLNAHLYAASDTFPLLADLKQSLQRHSIKDSVLDFPLAFARRRGIEPNAEGFCLHATQKLRSLTEKVSDRYQQCFHPAAYKKSQARQAALSARETLRQDAIIVAQYADARLEVGQLWQVIQNTMEKRGLDVKNPDFEQAAKRLPEYATMQDNVVLRDKLAAEIYPRAEYHALAIDLNRLDLQSLAKHALSHERRTLALRYHDVCQSGHTIPRDKLARVILNDIKGMYPHLKNNGVETKNLQQHATDYDKRVFLSQLPYPERQAQQKAFADIEQYLETGRTLAKIWHASVAKDWYQRGTGKYAASNSENQDATEKAQQQVVQVDTANNDADEVILHREQAVKLDALSRQQAAIAYGIVNHPERYAHALAFYNVGEGRVKSVDAAAAENINTTVETEKSSIDNPILLIRAAKTPEQKAAAIKRLQSLDSGAKRHATLLTVQSYHTAVKAGDRQAFGKIASLMVSEARGYHGALLSYRQFDAQKTAADWKMLRRDAERYELETAIAPLTAKERLIFIAVKDYVDAKRAHCKAWREILQGRDGETQLLDSLEKDAKNDFVQRMSRFSKPFTEMRNQLAAEIAENPMLYREALDHFKINPTELNKEAYAHTCKMNVQRYSEMGNDKGGDNNAAIRHIHRLEKAALAEAILKDPKAHHGAIVDLCASRLEALARVEQEKAQHAATVDSTASTSPRPSNDTADISVSHEASQQPMPPSPEGLHEGSSTDAPASENALSASASHPTQAARHREALAKDIKALWSSIRQDANILERKRYFEQLTPEEKQCQRLTNRYKKISQAIGQHYEKLSGHLGNNKPNAPHANRNDATLDVSVTDTASASTRTQAPSNKKSFTPIHPRLNRLFTTRNRLASQLTQKIASLDAWSRDMFVSDNRLKLDKLQAQHDKHLETEIKVGERLERRNTLTRYQEAIKNRQDARFQLAHTIEDDKRYYPILMEAYPEPAALKAFQQTLRQDANFYAHQLKKVAPQAQQQPHHHHHRQHESSALIPQVPHANAEDYQSAAGPSIHTQTAHKATGTEHNNPHYARIDVERLREDLNAAAENVALHYLGEPKKRQGTQWRYGDKKGSLAVTLSGTKQGSWYDFQTAEGGDMLKLITHATGKDFKESLKEAVNFLGGESRYLTGDTDLTPAQIAARERKHQAQLAREAMETQKKLQHVRTIVNGTQPIEGTLAERYLKEHRGITHQLNSDNLRFHPALKNWVTGDIKPALIILAHDDKHQLSGVQATFLDPCTANKARLEGATKLSRGTISQGSIVHHAVNPTENVNGINDNSNLSTQQPKTIALAEGLETALSVAEARPDWEVRLTFGVSNFERVAAHCSKNSALVDERSEPSTYNKKVESPVNTEFLSPQETQCSHVDNVVDVDVINKNKNTHHTNIIICADNDGIDSGTDKAVKKAVGNLQANGINVSVVEPAKPDGVKKWDFNDALKHNGIAAVRADLSQYPQTNLIQKQETPTMEPMSKQPETSTENTQSSSIDTPTKPPRTPWQENFPDVVVHTSVKDRDAHPCYEKAKNGDIESAFKLIHDMINPEKIDAIRKQLKGEKPIIVAVSAQEAHGENVIPDALANHLARALGAEVDQCIYQSNYVNHTRNSAFHRMAYPAVFGGEVQKGKNYLIVDDHVGVGGTLANLKGHIEKNGGSVILTTTLTASHNSQYLAPKQEELAQIKARHGEALDTFLKDEIGHRTDELTKAEVGQLLKAKSLDEIRNRFHTAKEKGSLSVLSRELLEQNDVKHVNVPLSPEKEEQYKNILREYQKIKVIADGSGIEKDYARLRRHTYQLKQNKALMAFTERKYPKTYSNITGYSKEHSALENLPPEQKVKFKNFLKHDQLLKAKAKKTRDTNDFKKSVRYANILNQNKLLMQFTYKNYPHIHKNIQSRADDYLCITQPLTQRKNNRLRH